MADPSRKQNLSIKNMRKKCVSCGLIAFATDEVCRRCGSDKIFNYHESDELTNIPVNSNRNFSYWNVSVCFVLSIIFEMVLILPILASIGWNHSSAGHSESSDLEKIYVLFTMVSHLPTIFVGGLLSFVIGELGYLLIPFLQSIIWTFLLLSVWKMIKNKLH